MIAFTCLSTSDQELVVMRSMCNAGDIETLCKYHSRKYLKYYEQNQFKCSDPFNCHKVTKRSLKYTVTIALCKETQRIGISAKPGQKLCINCNINLQERLIAEREETMQSSTTFLSTPGTSECDPAFHPASESPGETLRTLNTLLQGIDETPTKTARLSGSRRAKYTQGKVKISSSMKPN